MPNQTFLVTFRRCLTQGTFEATFISASLPTFATIPTCVVGGLMGQAFGRRLSLLLVAPIFAVSFILQAVATEVAMFQFGRFLSGIAGGLVSGPASVNGTTPKKSHLTTLRRQKLTVEY